MTAAADYGPPSVEKMLGALPVIRDFLRRLDVAGTVDRLCPVRDIARLTHGQVIEVLIANRLTCPTAMVRVADWAAAWAVEEVFDVPADALGDDRIARALDALAEQADQVVGSIGAAAVAGFGLDVSQVHWDMTSISLYGAYPETDPDYATPRYGHPKDRRPDLKQIQTGLGVLADGGVPLVARAYDGGAAEVCQVVGALRALRTAAGPRPFLLVGDTKLVSYTNLSALVATDGARFIAPAPRNVVPATVLAALDVTTAAPVDYVAVRDREKFAHQRAFYRACEGRTTVRGPRKKDPPLVVRTVHVWSSARAQAAVSARRLKLARATDELDRLVRTAGTRYHPDEQAVRARAEQVCRSRRVTGLVHYEIDADEASGKTTFTWAFDETALAAEAASDGWYALLTNLTVAEADAAEVLRRYKGQEKVERRYSDYKGPLAVAPLFLRSNQRIDGLIHVICLALLVFSLIEREVRRAIAPAEKLPGLYAGRPARPTGRLVFEALAALRLVPAIGGQPAYIPWPGTLQRHLLDLLGVDPTQPP
ncbi:IS1634 family transposase [Pseudofrankia sp. BMG5.36]|uniref:IS1634 family transposase n=1 Tax=Pseudofrankia sp. BMG5.36 TaxID=1834512 RepID=UPI0008D932F6|nr:IS1634 family transposase [Pseudofrankia sp. BMG5.36]OHV44491.1 transposase [Pseudofrankia sp. BMG5.36]